MDNGRTISHTFYCPIYTMDEGNEDMWLVWDSISLFFLFGVNQLNCFGLKPGAQKECLMCILSAKVTDLRGRLKCQQGDTSWVWYYILIAVGSRLIPCIRGLVDSTTALNRRSDSRESRTPFRKFFWNGETSVKDQWWERWKALLGYIECYLCFT